jgi:hypothetical protein
MVVRSAQAQARRARAFRGLGDVGQGQHAVVVRHLKDDEIEAIWSYIRATSGKDNMPSWYGILKDDEIEAIWSYIRATVDR